MGNVHYHIQLKSALSGLSINSTGGTCLVTQAGSTDKQTLYDSTGAALTNPIQMTTGTIDFYVVDTTASVDLHILSPGGHFITRNTVTPSGPNEISIDATQRRQVMRLPYSITDSVAATEQDTGFDLPNPAVVLNRLHGLGLFVTVLESAKTLDVGLGEVHPAESGGDANGWIAASSIATAGLVTGTDGALFSTNAPHKSDAVTAKSITYTISTGATLAKGWILIPYELQS